MATAISPIIIAFQIVPNNVELWTWCTDVFAISYWILMALNSISEKEKKMPSILNIIILVRRINETLQGQARDIYEWKESKLDYWIWYPRIPQKESMT